jgi:hypothetical protein
MRRALCTPPGSPTWLDRQLPVGGGLVGRILLPRGVDGLGLRVGLLFGENAVQARLEARDGAVPPAFPAHFVLLEGVVSVAVDVHRALDVRLRAVMAGRGSEASCDLCVAVSRGRGS